MKSILPWLAVAVLASCGPSQLPKNGTPTDAVRAASWMQPQAQSDDLLYVSDAGGSVYVFSYPAGKMVGILTGFQGPAGLCSDSSGDVFVVDTPREGILEYKHGGKSPTRIVGASGYPEGCAVDPSTGNLAVTNYQTALPPGPGSVSIYSATNRGKSSTYRDPSFNEFFFCGYDNNGNLYVDGVNSGTTAAQFAELPRGETSLRDFKLNKRVAYPGGIQWDGGNIAIEDLSTNVLYRVKVSGSSGKVVGSARFAGVHSALLTQFWIQNGTIVLPYGELARGVHRVGFWVYPAGGSAKKTLEPRGDVELLGATVSLRH